MAKRTIRERINKKLTAEERQRYDQIRKQIESEKPRLEEAGLKAKAKHDARLARLKEAVTSLKNTREELGLSLSDIRAITGIDKANLSRLENASDPNPTIDTLTRYADAVGKEILITLADK